MLVPGSNHNTFVSNDRNFRILIKITNKLKYYHNSTIKD